MQNEKNLCMGCMNEKDAEGVCTVCGFDEISEPNGKDYLQLRTVIADRYIIGHLIDSNGEGATYKGYDKNTNTTVRIREYCPMNLCTRAADGSVFVNLGDEAPFEAGKAAFEDLAKNLSHLNDLPALVPVTDIFKANGTVYYVTDSFIGITLREFLMRNSGALKWEQVRPLFLPIISTVKALHSAGIVHMGISPETLMVCRDGKLRLVGFCIKEARTARNNITGQLYPGFAAIEQYGTDSQQGPWTDVYGFAATIYRTLVGNPPMEATERVTNDNMTIPAKVAQTLPQQVMIALANALQILPEDRTQSMTEFRGELLATDNSGSMLVKTKGDAKDKKKSITKRYSLLSSVITAVVLIVAFILVWWFFLRTPGDSDPVGSGITPPPMSSIASTSYPDTVTLYQVPNVIGSTFADTTGDPDFEKNFEIEIVSLGYHDEYKRGQIYEQSPVAGENVTKGTVIQVRISLGPAQISTGTLLGMQYEEAYIRLLELGFLPQNIHRIDVQDPFSEPGSVTHAIPTASELISPEGSVTLYVNIMESNDSSSQIDGTSSEEGGEGITDITTEY